MKQTTIELTEKELEKVISSLGLAFTLAATGVQSQVILRLQRKLEDAHSCLAEGELIIKVKPE